MKVLRSDDELDAAEQRSAGTRTPRGGPGRAQAMRREVARLAEAPGDRTRGGGWVARPPAGRATASGRRVPPTAASARSRSSCTSPRRSSGSCGSPGRDHLLSAAAPLPPDRDGRQQRLPQRPNPAASRINVSSRARGQVAGSTPLQGGRMRVIVEPGRTRERDAAGSPGRARRVRAAELGRWAPVRIVETPPARPDARAGHPPSIQMRAGRWAGRPDVEHPGLAGERSLGRLLRGDGNRNARDLLFDGLPEVCEPAAASRAGTLRSRTPSPSATRSGSRSTRSCCISRSRNGRRAEGTNGGRIGPSRDARARRAMQGSGPVRAVRRARGSLPAAVDPGVRTGESGTLSRRGRGGLS